MAEGHRGCDREMAAEPIRERSRHFDPQAARRIDPDGLVTAGLTRFTVGGQKPSGCVPALPPLSLSQLSGDKIRGGVPQPFTAHRIDGRPAVCAASASASRCRRIASRRVLANHCAASRIATYRGGATAVADHPTIPGPGRYLAGSQRAAACSTVTAARRSATSAPSPRSPSWY